MDARKEKLQAHCEKVLVELKKNYWKEVQYGGTFSSVWKRYSDAVHILKSNGSVNEINISQWLRPVVDELREYHNPLIDEMDQAETLYDRLTE
ncbi:hypothetical protein P6709_10140 [Jeotgalibacillus sp. ET6]|uniref:hypothetical protein n=1 Tax=Jeotgalibacillus sp. ET6 TaxID=3037260 RepID=UPI002418B4C1|nr:hypothetical protein [Jeotgalibacillus sp. ET6]MDG5472112.1 hypothetical protein [Jeotgalibacillus sp. ET6]